MALITLLPVDSKIPNLALMKLSAWHKAKGDRVQIHSAWDKPDLLYASKIFDFTPDYQYYPDCEVVRGGTGYDINARLPDGAEGMMPDYDLFNCKYAMGFTTRGCIRKYPFCLVPEKEGAIRVVGDLYNFWQGQDRVMLLDNNLAALPEQFERICKQVMKEQVRVDFSQGLDIRLITPVMAQLLSKVKLWKQIHFAFDHVSHENAVRRGIETLTSNGVSKHKLMFYVLIGFDSTPEQDLYRVELLRWLGVDPFVMPYDKRDEYQRRFARWCNHKAIFNTVSWGDYR